MASPFSPGVGQGWTDPGKKVEAPDTGYKSNVDAETKN